jgi:antitoxin (DNA-binding transcriptional repressor) of toxin-antitoxin stability system
MLMTTTITQRELRNDSGEIMRRLDQGETFIVTRNGMPVGELSPLHRPRFVTATVAADLFRHAPMIDARGLQADLDAVTDQRIEPRG